MLFRVVKYFLIPIVVKVRYAFSITNLLVKNPSLICGRNVSVIDSTLGKYNKLSSDSALVDSSIGDYSYLANSAKLRGVTIGKFSCIGPNVSIGLGDHPTKKFVSVHPIFYSTEKLVGTSFVNESYFEEHALKVNIGNDVWLGANVMVTKSVTIGNGSIVAAGSIVTKNIPPYSIVAGIPAKVIRKRFDEAQIAFLEKFKWWEKDQKWLKENVMLMHDISNFYQEKRREFNHEL